MINEYVLTEVKKILNDKSFASPLNLAMASAWIMGNLKAINLKLFDVTETSSLGDFYLLGSATNPVQANAIAEEIGDVFKHFDYKTLSREGGRGSEWILLDYGDVLIHIFHDLSRDVFDLDGLCRENEQIQIPHEYYHSNPEDERIFNTPKSDDYF